MDTNGIFLAIVVTTETGDRCLQHNLSGATIDREYPVTLDGIAGSLEVFTLPFSGEPSMVLNALHSGYCYQFDFITLSQTVRDANENSAAQMFNSFRFGTGPV
jgi:hypothetical protein